MEPLIKKLEALWETFIGSIASNLKDHLSLEHLGHILRNLAGIGKQYFDTEINFKEE